MSRSRPSMEDFSVVIPTLNEENNIGRVIEGIREAGDPEIIVVDDGSADRTREIAARKNVEVVERGGKDSLSLSVLEGLREASNEKVVVMDGDGQHPPDKIPEIVSGLGSRELFVVSRRDVEGHWRFSRRLMSLGAQCIVKTAFDRCREVEDPVSGFFGVRKSRLDMDRLQPRGYKILVEILVTHDLDIGETTYVFLQRDNGDSSIGPESIKDFLLHVIHLKYRQVKHGKG